ncbi:MAG TPA: hypothetical protein VFM54_15495, partial [Micromonosporaceae bacterium]|nr:hypothetical protein [Micromonosporaceae bacterium]
QDNSRQPFIDARAFQPDLAPDAFIEAYAACGGIRCTFRWSAARSTMQNLDELAFTPGGLLLRDAPDIMSEDLDWRGGHERVLMDMSGGPGAGPASPAGRSSGSTTRWTGCAGRGMCGSCARWERAARPACCTRSPTATWRSGSPSCATTPT